MNALVSIRDAILTANEINKLPITQGIPTSSQYIILDINPEC